MQFFRSVKRKSVAQMWRRMLNALGHASGREKHSSPTTSPKIANGSKIVSVFHLHKGGFAVAVLVPAEMDIICILSELIYPTFHLPAQSLQYSFSSAFSENQHYLVAFNSLMNSFTNTF